MEGDQKGTIPFAKYRALTEITRQKLMKRTHQFVCSQREDQKDELSSAKSYQCESSHLMGNSKNADEGEPKSYKAAKNTRWSSCREGEAAEKQQKQDGSEQVKAPNVLRRNTSLPQSMPQEMIVDYQSMREVELCWVEEEEEEKEEEMVRSLNMDSPKALRY